MTYKPPKKLTIKISFIFIFIGVILAILGLTGILPPNFDQIFIIIGLILLVVAWLLVVLGVFIVGI